MKNKKYFIYVGLMMSMLALGGAATVFGGNKKYSENENRYLTDFDKPSLTEFLSGSLQENVTEAMDDQFWNRDAWTSLSTGVEKMLGNKDVGGVYLGEDNYYFAKTMNQDISQTNYFQNLRFVRDLANQQKDAKVTALLVPSPGSILRDKLPSHAVLYDDEAMYQAAEAMLSDDIFLDIRNALRNIASSNQLYFRTDHHWTLRGAYTAYQGYSQRMERESGSYDSFGIKAVSDSFYGTLYSKVLDSRAMPDELDTIQNLPEVRVKCDGDVRDTIYDNGKLAQKDKYAYYFGGNYGKVQVENESGAKRKLLVIKDSYANTMIPFLLKDYQQITMLDLRYCKETVSKILNEYQPDEILILYEMSNFAQDTRLHNLTK